MNEQITVALMTMLKELRSKTNVLGFPKKILIVSDKLWNTFMVKQVLRYVQEDPSNTLLTDEDDWVQLDT